MLFCSQNVQLSGFGKSATLPTLSEEELVGGGRITQESHEGRDSLVPRKGEVGAGRRPREKEGILCSTQSCKNEARVDKGQRLMLFGEVSAQVRDGVEVGSSVGPNGLD